VNRVPLRTPRVVANALSTSTSIIHRRITSRVYYRKKKTKRNKIPDTNMLPALHRSAGSSNRSLRPAPTVRWKSLINFLMYFLHLLPLPLHISGRDVSIPLPHFNSSLAEHSLQRHTQPAPSAYTRRCPLKD
jgi:hypothetical protein